MFLSRNIIVKIKQALVHNSTSNLFYKQSFGFTKQFNYELRKTTNLLQLKLKEKQEEYENISNFFNNNDGSNDIETVNQKRQRLDELEVYRQCYSEFTNVLNDLNELIKMQHESQQSNDKETQEFVQEELANQEALLEQIEEKAIDLFLPKDKFEDSNCINVEIRGGVGGSESSLFAEDINKMYQNYFDFSGWKILQYQTDGQIGRGCKVCIMKVNGYGVYKRMKCESGVHKVIRVPETEKMGRLHSSTISVVVIPEIPLDFKLDEKELRIEFMRSSGPGGQHVNKVESACRVTHMPSGLQVHIQDERNQNTNKQRALQLMKDKLFQREVMRNQEEISEQRRGQVETGDRSEKIRTYNFPQSRVTDHRTGLTVFGIEKMLSGEYLDQFIEEYQNKIYSIRLAQLFQDV